MEIKTTTTYVAFDGAEFPTEELCVTYENFKKIYTSNEFPIDTLEHKPADIPFAWCGVGGKFYLCKNEKERQILLDYIHDEYYDSSSWVNKEDIAIGWNLVVDDMNDPTVCNIYTMKQYMSDLMAAIESVKEVM